MKVSTFIQVAMIDNFYIVHLFLLYTFPAYFHELFQSKVTNISKLRLIPKFKNTTHNAREHKTETIQTYLIVLMISISMKEILTCFKK